jgi:ribosomal protein S18 acetylase RimI-like enzyme
MKTIPSNVVIRAANAGDATRLEEVRRVAFAPVFASFRSILGEDIYNLAQAREEEAQAGYLTSLLAPGSEWEVYAAEQAGIVVGFVSVRLSLDNAIGEIGLNAVHPDWAGEGIGTEMYRFAIERMRQAGMRVATVSTGGDSSHAPARRAYEKAGFNVGIPSIWLCQKL